MSKYTHDTPINVTKLPKPTIFKLKVFTLSATLPLIPPSFLRPPISAIPTSQQYLTSDIFSPAEIVLVMLGIVLVELSLQFSQTIIFVIIADLRPAMFTIDGLQQVREAFWNGFTVT
jgi:hypothetical protein